MLVVLLSGSFLIVVLILAEDSVEDSATDIVADSVVVSTVGSMTEVVVLVDVLVVDVVEDDAEVGFGCTEVCVEAEDAAVEVTSVESTDVNPLVIVSTVIDPLDDAEVSGSVLIVGLISVADSEIVSGVDIVADSVSTTGVKVRTQVDSVLVSDTKDVVISFVVTDVVDFRKDVVSTGSDRGVFSVGLDVKVVAEPEPLAVIVLAVVDPN